MDDGTVLRLRLDQFAASEWSGLCSATDEVQPADSCFGEGHGWFEWRLPAEITRFRVICESRWCLNPWRAPPLRNSRPTRSGVSRIPSQASSKPSFMEMGRIWEMKGAAAIFVPLNTIPNRGNFSFSPNVLLRCR
jgi:hypothetical protein